MFNWFVSQFSTVLPSGGEKECGSSETVRHPLVKVPPVGHCIAPTGTTEGRIPLKPRFAAAPKTLRVRSMASAARFFLWFMLLTHFQVIVVERASRPLPHIRVTGELTPSYIHDNPWISLGTDN